MNIVWLHRDLRLADNPALFHAAKPGKGVVAVFQACPEEWAAHDDAPVKIDFWLRNLAELSKTLAAKNIALRFRIVKRKDIAKDLVAVAKELGASEVHYNIEYEINEAGRNAEAAAALEKAGIKVIAHHAQSTVPPDDIRTGEGRFYTVYSPFKRTCYKLFEERRLALTPDPRKQPEMIGTPDPIPAVINGFESPVGAEHWPAGEAWAQRRLGQFVECRLTKYKADRDTPSIDATSMLSPHLAAGVISPRQCILPALEANKGKYDVGNEGVAHWISEVVWRDFYRHVLVGFPRVCMGRAFKPATERIVWNDDEAAFDAWREGRTGVPIVDAAMRQLKGLGWMHNRLRMVTAMYLTKDLFLDWRRGERHFMRHLIDGDLASNNGGWQWSASTGTDAAPYFRIFNPYSQSEKCDPEGVFIRQWVPELAGLDAKDIHDPSAIPALLRGKLDYPSKPIADHAKARERVMKAFQGIA
ncbi:MAG: cryptochrome/photolyase family protein [Phycisphaerales bacterium]